MRKIILTLIAAGRLAVALVASPVATVGHHPDGTAVTALGQAPDTAAAQQGYVWNTSTGLVYVHTTIGGWRSLAPGQSTFDVNYFQAPVGMYAQYRVITTGVGFYCWSGMTCLTGYRDIMIVKVAPDPT